MGGGEGGILHLLNRYVLLNRVIVFRAMSVLNRVYSQFHYWASLTGVCFKLQISGLHGAKKIFQEIQFHDISLKIT